MTDSQNEESISIVQLTQTDSDREIGSLVLSGGFVTWSYSIAGEDYIASNGTLEFAPGQLSQTITVQGIGDTETEENETFLLNLSNPVNAALGDSQGTGTIINDEIDSLISIGDISAEESKGRATITDDSQ